MTVLDNTEFFSDRNEIEIRAWFLGHRLDLKALAQMQRLTISPYVIRAGHDGYAVLFRYGVAVLFGLTEEEEQKFIEDCSPYIINPFDNRDLENEEGTVVVNQNKPETVIPEYIRIKEWDLDRIQVIADALAKSSALSYYESLIAKTFDKIEPVASKMQEGIFVSGSVSRDILKHIGMTLSVQRTMVGQVEIEEKPEVLWERPELERLFHRLEDEYELTERHTALKDKLELIYQTADTMNGILQYRRSQRAGWYIVFLIMIFIVMSTYEMIAHYLQHS
jgi:uncharacterized Rmd1/YagE family protein